jgi:DNA-binding transcriptional ArsR family regulator
MTDGDGFDLLADDTRAAIVRALAEARRESPADPWLSFSELRERVGATDSGRFNYHLGKLRGHLVAKTADGYRLSPVGGEAAGALLAGAYSDPEDRGPVDLDDHCGRCGDVLTASYTDGVLVVTCENDHGFADAVPAAAIEDASLPEATRVLDATMRADVTAARRGVCPTCHGELSVDVVTDLDDDAPVAFSYVGVCQACGRQLSLNPGLFVFDHPAVVAAYHEAGVDIRDRPLWTIDCCIAGSGELVAEDPLRAAVRAGPDRDLRFVLDDTGTVVGSP